MLVVRVGFFVYLAALTVLLLAPDPNAMTGIEQLPGFLEDHLLHLLALLGLTLLAHASRWPLGTGVLVGLLAVYAVAVEVLQVYSPPRDVQLKDLVENVLGVVLGTVLWWAVVRPRMARRQA